MATLYTTKLRLALPATGDLFGLWGDVANNGITQSVEDAIAGRVVVAHDDSASYTLTANNGVTDEARNFVLRITGTLTAARNVVCPTSSKLYILENATTGGFAVTLKTAAGAGVSVAAGDAALLRCDGVDVLDWMPVTGTGAAVRATSPTLVTPALGTPASGVMTNVTGTALGLTAGAANALKSATTTVDVVASPAPAVDQVLVATGGSSATWQAVPPASNLNSATTVVNVGAAAAPSAGQVLVATGPTAATWQSIAGGTVLTNVTNVFTKNQSIEPEDLVPGATIPTDAALSNVFKIILDQDSTLANPTNLTHGMNLQWLVYQDGTGGWTLGYDSKFEWLVGSPPTITAAASARNVVSCVYDADIDILLCVWQGQ